MDFGEPFGGLIPGARGAALAALLRTGAPLTGRRVHALRLVCGSGEILAWGAIGARRAGLPREREWRGHIRRGCGDVGQRGRVWHGKR